LRGRSLRGARLEADAPFAHWRTQTFIAGLRVDELAAPWVLDGPMNRAAFETYIETQLAPCLQPGEVVIADNMSSHKSAVAQAFLKAQGNWLLFLPPYSPDLRHAVRSCRRSMRTLPSTRMSELLQGYGVCGTLNGWRSRHNGS
jgi:transposase